MSNPFACKRCLKDYVNKQRLIRHLKGRRQCTVVEGGEDIDRNILIEKIRTNQISYKCAQCNKSFLSEVAMNNHCISCLGNTCFHQQKLKVVNDPEIKKIINIAYKLLIVVRKTWIGENKKYIKSSANGYFYIYENGKWSEPYKKKEFMCIVLKALAKSSKAPQPLKDQIYKMVCDSENSRQLSRTNCYNRFSEGLEKLLFNRNNILKPKQFLMEEEKERKLRFKANKKHHEYKEKAQEKYIEQVKIDKQKPLVAEMKIDGQEYFDEVDLGNKHCENTRLLCFELRTVYPKYVDEILEYFVANSKRKDAEEISNHIWQEEKYYRQEYYENYPRCMI